MDNVLTPQLDAEKREIIERELGSISNQGTEKSGGSKV